MIRNLDERLIAFLFMSNGIGKLANALAIERIPNERPYYRSAITINPVTGYIKNAIKEIVKGYIG
jgi:hypothetical protein